jgi:hypothetical protein
MSAEKIPPRARIWKKGAKKNFGYDAACAAQIKQQGVIR